MKVKINKEKILESIVKRAEGFYYTEEILEYSKKESKKNGEKNNETIAETCDEKNNCENSVSNCIKNKNDDIYSGRKRMSDEANVIVLGDRKNESEQDLELLKKKITTHYVPPDMSALKILLENFGEEMKSGDGFVETMTDEELLKMKVELLRELEKF